MEYLVVLEVSQKQNYIFKTNRLAENIGASIIIRDITEELGKKYLQADNQEKYGTQGGEYWFAGGGKSIYTFPTENAAKNFVRCISTEVIRNYPGTELFMAHIGYGKSEEKKPIMSIVEAVDELYGKLEQKKAERQSAFCLLGLGITEKCVSTQLPAVKNDPLRGLLSAESAKKYEIAEKRQNEFFKWLLPNPDAYVFASEFEELGGTKDEKDYLAVVVLDGNKLGKKIESFKNDFKNGFDKKYREDHGEVLEDEEYWRQFNSEYKSSFREFSSNIDKTWKGAMKRMTARLCDKMDDLIRKEVVCSNTRKVGDIEKTVLPMRPLILAGDDICFVCDSRIAVSLTEILLKEVEAVDESNERPGLRGLHAAAGIAIVKNHYPFFRAHELAEALCHNAKSVLPSGDEGDESVIDFIPIEGEIAGSLEEIRREKYRISEKSGCRLSMTNKPYYLHRDGPIEKDRRNSLPFFKERMKQFRDDDDIGRGFIKEYCDALFAGKAAADRYLVHKRKEKMIESSFENGVCRDFDVIEMLDMYYDLMEDEE